MQWNTRISIRFGRKLRGHLDESAKAVGNCKSSAKLILAKRSYLEIPLHHLPLSFNHTHTALVKWQIPVIWTLFWIHLSSFHTTKTPERTHFDHTTPAVDTLLESIVLRGHRSFHRSKMVLWTYLHQHTSNAGTTFPLGQMAGISNVFTALCSNMSQPEKNALFITDSVNNI